MPLNPDVSHGTSADLPSIVIPVGTSFDIAQRALLVATLDATGWDKRHASQVLGCSLKTIYNLVMKYRLKPPKLPAVLPRSAA